MIIQKHKNLDINLNILYIDNFFSKKEADNYFKILEDTLTYNTAEESKVMIRGKYIEIPRKQVAYGEKGTFYNFAGIKVMAKDWNKDGKVIKEIVDKVNKYLNKNFNFVLVNRYNNGDDYIGYHHDDERDLVKKSQIVGISFGAKRSMYFQNDDGVKTLDVSLSNGSMIIIDYPTNEHYKHSIPKTKKVTEPRISLTLREMRKS